MQDKDNKLIWEQYSTTDVSKEQPLQTQQLTPDAITAEHLIYPNVLYGELFEEDYVGDYGNSGEYKHFVDQYYAAKNELMEDQDNMHDPDSGMYAANDIVVLVAGLDYKYVKDDTENVVILSGLPGEIGFYIDSQTAVRLDQRQVDAITTSNITWVYDKPNNKTATIHVGRELQNKYDELLREGSDDY